MEVTVLQRHDFEPTEKDIIWAQQLISSLKEGGTWAVPMNGQIYRIYHAKKELHYVAGEGIDLFNRCKRVFFKCGYKTIDKRNQNLRS